MRIRTLVQRLTLLIFVSVLAVVPGFADDPPQQEKRAAAAEQKPSADQTGELAKAVQNPVASLISVPFQNNTNFDIGPNNRTQNVLNIQPVIPTRSVKTGT